MKNFFLYLFIILSFTFTSCKKNVKQSNEEKLAALKKQQTELTQQIKDLETIINKDKPQVATNLKTVGITPVSRDTFTHYIEVQGKVEGDNNVNVSAKVPSTITRIYVTKGQHVNAGQMLASLDAGVVQQSIDQIKSQLAFAQNIYQKQKNLWDQGIGSEVQYLTAKNNVTALQKQIATTEQQYKMYSITAPISGTVDEVIAKDGEAAAPGFPAFRIVNLSSLKVTGMIADTYIDQVKSGNQVILDFPDLNKTLQARIKATSSVIDPVSRAFGIEIRPQDTRDLKPNLIAKIKIKDYENGNAIILPINSVQNTDDGSYVYVAVAKGTNTIAEKRMITTGKTYNDSIEVIDGLNETDQVITTGAEELVNGDFIKF